MAAHGHPARAASYNNMAATFHLEGQYEAALELFTKGLAIEIREHGPDHPAVAATYNNMAVVYFKQSKYGKALELFEKCLAIEIKANGPDHQV
ncbi:Tetratricopeptide repeat-domain-containing protein [Baffinella frigidus]|nr:Tetratricopeptide repeat-domain-containing protein [Cryptophyta sp. CCMP2293]